MSLTKRLIEQLEQRRGVATGIALQARVLKSCPIHSDCVYSGGADIEGAYKLGNYKYSAGEFDGLFDDRTQMTDAIKNVVENNSMIDECPRCERMMEDQDRVSRW
jgi:hypothetical protein